MFSLTPRIDRIMQGIKAGKQRTGKLVATLLGDPQEPADRRDLEWLFLGFVQAQD